MAIESKTKELTECGLRTTVVYTDDTPALLALLRSLKVTLWLSLSAGITYLVANLTTYLSGWHISELNKGLIFAVLTVLLGGIQKYIDTVKSQNDTIVTEPPVVKPKE